jgi:MHS family proline/betaine transporter-like MFS transporter
MPTYLITELNVGETEAFLTVSISLAIYVLSIFVMGAISDKIGRKVALILASILFIALTVPLFAMLDGATLTGIILIQIAFGILLTVNDGTLPCFLTEIFPTRVRYSGFAFSFNTAQAFLGGTAPLIATFLINITGSKLAPAWYLVAIAVVSLLAMCFARETAGKPLAD